jgi:hypothetical protein
MHFCPDELSIVMYISLSLQSLLSRLWLVRVWVEGVWRHR